MKHTKAADGPKLAHASELGNAIVELRKSHGMSRTDFAKRLGIQYRTVMRWERGVTIPQPSFLRDMIGISPENLRHVFEEACGSTFEQVSLESSPIGPEPEIKNDWMIHPENYTDDIHYAIQQRIRVLYLRSKNGDDRAAQKMAALLAHVLSVTE